MTIFDKLKKNTNIIKLIFFKAVGSGSGLLIYTIALNISGNFFALAHSGFVTSYQIGQAGCTFERNLNSKSALDIFLQNGLMRFIFSSLWLLTLLIFFNIDIYLVSFFGFFISFLYLAYFDEHTKFIGKSSFMLSMLPIFTTLIIFLLYYFNPYNFKIDNFLEYKLKLLFGFVVLLTVFYIGLIINRNNKFFLFEILYNSVPIFLISFILKNQTDERITFHVLIFYKIIEFIWAGCYFVLTGSKKMSFIIKNFSTIKKYYSIFLIFLIPIIILIDGNIIIIVVFWVLLLRITSFLLLSYKIHLSIIYITYSIMIIYSANFINEILFLTLIIIPNIIFLIFQKKIKFSNFKNLNFKMKE